MTRQAQPQPMPTEGRTLFFQGQRKDGTFDQSFPPWRSPKGAWMWSWTPISGWCCLCKGLRPDDLQMTSILSHSVILWRSAHIACTVNNTLVLGPLVAWCHHLVPITLVPAGGAFLRVWDFWWRVTTAMLTAPQQLQPCRPSFQELRMWETPALTTAFVVPFAQPDYSAFARLLLCVVQIAGLQSRKEYFRKRFAFEYLCLLSHRRY